MRYARMTAPGRVSVSVPQLSGGLNQFDQPNRVADNQLTECENMWWHNGALRTRPGLKLEKKDNAAIRIADYNVRQSITERETLLTRIVDRGDGHKEFVAAVLTTEEGMWHAGANSGAAGSVYITPIREDNVTLTAMGIKAGGRQSADRTNWYYLLSDGTVLKENWETPVPTGDAGWISAEPYIPTVMINGAGEEYAADSGASAYEDYNMLTRAFICTYTTDGVSGTWKLPMEDLSSDLPGVSLDSEAGGTMARIELTLFDQDTGALRTVPITLKVDENTGTVLPVDVSLTVGEVGLENTDYTSVKLRVTMKPATGIIQFKLYGMSQGESYIDAGLPFVTDNNLKITAWRNRSYEENRLTICRMTRNTWYGGERSGIAGGTRLFVCGNPDKPNLIHWSGLNEALYFPEHNHTYVGDASQAVTAFGKQEDMLIVFKEHELYAAQYAAGTEEELTFAQSGGVALTNYAAQFPLTPIHAVIGCDCPDTVRLVNNRLVWADSSGQVYMLTAVNQYSERNVRMISRNVREQMKAHGAAVLKTAMAGEYYGYYTLLAGNKMYMLDTQTSAFVSFNYYTDEDSARKALPWFVWSFPEELKFTGLVSDDTWLRMTATNTVTGESVVATLEGDTDGDSPVASHFATRMWDFDRADYKKSVEQLYVGAQAPGGGRIRVSYVTEKGVLQDGYELADRGNVNPADTGYIHRMRMTPNVRLVQAVGIRFESETPMAVDGLTIKVKMQGVVR